MFGGIFVKILLGLLAASLLTGAGIYVKYNWFDKPAYEKQIIALQNERTELKVTEAKQKAEIESLKVKQVVKKRVSNAQEKVDVDVTDSGAVVDFFRLRRKGGLPNPPDGKKSSPGPATR